ncbi:hypothetical protein BYT27DRAFT_7106656 [Phlegmacium glaucopus]|nr:hypothetical protein BYT27DRAFT_7106656 [Phlegmacium glaucopus]
MEVRRSSRVVSSKARSSQASMVGTSDQAVEALAGGKRTVGHVSLVAGGPVSTGHKRSAMSAALGSICHGRELTPLASASDFPPGHFDEPFSDDCVPPITGTSPMRVDQAGRITAPILSPMSQNPLFQRPAVVSGFTPSPRSQCSGHFRTRDGNVAWAAMEGLLPIPDGFKATGYAPVGGVTYKVQSPHLQDLGSQGSRKGRRLFEGYEEGAQTGRFGHPQVARQAGQQIAMQANMQDFSQQIAMQANTQGVCYCDVSTHSIYSMVQITTSIQTCRRSFTMLNLGSGAF